MAIISLCRIIALLPLVVAVRVCMFVLRKRKGVKVPPG